MIIQTQIHDFPSSAWAVKRENCPLHRGHVQSAASASCGLAVADGSHDGAQPALLHQLRVDLEQQPAVFRSLEPLVNVLHAAIEDKQCKASELPERVHACCSEADCSRRSCGTSARRTFIKTSAESASSASRNALRSVSFAPTATTAFRTQAALRSFRAVFFDANGGSARAAFSASPAFAVRRRESTRFSRSPSDASRAAARTVSRSDGRIAAVCAVASSITIHFQAAMLYLIAITKIPPEVPVLCRWGSPQKPATMFWISPSNAASSWTSSSAAAIFGSKSPQCCDWMGLSQHISHTHGGCPPD